MIKTLEFNMSEPDEVTEATLCENGKKYWNILYDLSNELRNARKYSAFDGESITDTEVESISKVEGVLFELLDSHNINLNDIP